ncbi:SPOR domain-containing protein [Robiginitalea aurantiaca]|uniref:SPOR domain-containing protein n=1 Tax=Robiginitalea aurantiaca TaxID=3056915 RepID=A0ABT7WBX1_9FLAO|nr:SPOR domain-containing protein [Robiginitalea aurantiaca]MDM9630410.1 SPOR domain-containing protein [Robiginitalea aurantiaca]
MYKLLFISLFTVCFTLNLQAQQGSVSIEQDPQIKKLLDIYKQGKANALYYTIQIGFGSYDEAEELKQEAEIEFPEYDPKIVFDSPTYRVQVGQFTDRLEAEKKFLEVRQRFPGALLLRPESGNR